MRLSRTALLASFVSLLCVSLSHAQTVKGEFTVNGKTSPLAFASALEVDSSTEPGYLDVVVVLADRKVSPKVMADSEQMEQMTRRGELSALRFVIDPDAKIKSAAPYSPAMKTFIESGAFVRWKPSAYDEKQVAGRVYTDGEQELAGQKWKYDLTFSAPIVLDPEAKTVKLNK